MKLNMHQGLIIGPYEHYSLAIAMALGGMSLAGNERFSSLSVPLIGLATLLDLSSSP